MSEKMIAASNAETADRLQRHLGGEFRCEAEVEKAAGFRAQLAIFRQVTAGLPHHPDRRYGLAVARKHFEKRLDDRILWQGVFRRCWAAFSGPSDTLPIGF